MNKVQRTTSHNLISGDSRNLNKVDDHSIDLVVTSPPYPMIAMWDAVFGTLNSKIDKEVIETDGNQAFKLMHTELDKVWNEIQRVLKPGGMACINIGDATRTVASEFRLYPNHSRIIESFTRIGFSNLPNIIWRKPTNAPNKFMGSGTLPVGAYVTLEHEFILIFRKENKREFDIKEDKASRRESAFFWEERNKWFSDSWDLKGTTQKLDNQSRNRSAAYPFEIPHRLINMYSVIGDSILDPFNGTGTTTKAAIANGRNSTGYEIDPSLNEAIRKELEGQLKKFQHIINNRLQKHLDFVNSKSAGLMLHRNDHYNFAVKTRQETSIRFPSLQSIEIGDDIIRAYYQ